MRRQQIMLRHVFTPFASLFPNGYVPFPLSTPRLPDVFVTLYVDLVEHAVRRLPRDVSLHLHGNVTWQHRE